MVNRLVHVTAPPWEDPNDLLESYKEGEGVALNGHLLFWWDLGRDGANRTKEMIGKLERALEIKVETASIHVKSWWCDEEIEACVRGLLQAKYGPGWVVNP